MKNLQKGFAAQALIVIIVLLVIAGGVYLYENNMARTSASSISTNSNNAGSSSVSTPLTETPSSAVVQNISGWKTYTDSQNGFQIQYPSDITNVQMTLATNISGPEVDFYLPNSYGTVGSDFGGADIGVSIIDTIPCTPASFDTTYMYGAAKRDPSFVKSPLSSLIEKGLTNQIFQGVQATGKGDRTDSYYLYTTPYGSQCYGIFLHTYNGWFNSGKGLTVFDPSTLQPLLIKMISSLLFTGSGKPSITSNYPSGGQTLINDPAYSTPLATILWNSTNAGALKVNIDLLNRNGAIVKNIANNVPNVGSYFWNSDPTISNGTYKIEISYRSNGGIIANSISNLFTVGSPNTSQHPTSGWQTYVNPQYSFSVQYPTDFMATSSNVGTNIYIASTTAIAFFANNHYFPEITLNGHSLETGTGEVSISVNNNVENCPPPVLPVDESSRVLVGGVGGTWTKVYYRGDAAMQHSYNHTGYFLIHGGKCYNINLSTVTSSLSAYAQDNAELQQINAQTQQNAAKALNINSTVDKLVASMTFIQ